MVPTNGALPILGVPFHHGGGHDQAGPAVIGCSV
jgi:hypothetical protein